MINLKTWLYANRKLVSVCAVLLAVFSVLVPIKSSGQSSIDDKTEETSQEALYSGYEISIDNKAVCVVANENQASELVEQLLTKAKNYYQSDKIYSPVNKIEVTQGLFTKDCFFTEENAKESMGTKVLFGAPTVTTLSGDNITLSLSETVISEKYVETKYSVEYEYTYGVSQSYEKVITEGKNGVIKQLYETKEINGEAISQKLVFENVLSEPENCVIEVGVTPSMQLASSDLAFFIKPYDGKISSDYGYRYLNGLEFHTGIDIVAKSGSCNGKTAVAAADGVVVESGYSSSRGNYVIIEHDFGFSTVYMHFKKRLVSKGDTVKAGDPVGLIGSTGRSTGSHLHFEIRLNGKHTDPENYLSFK